MKTFSEFQYEQKKLLLEETQEVVKIDKRACKYIFNNIKKYLEDISYVDSKTNEDITINVDDNKEVSIRWSYIPKENDTITLFGQVKNFETFPEIRLTPSNVEPLSRIFMDSSLLVNADKKPLLKEKLDFQRRIADSFMPVVGMFQYDKYLSYIFSTEIFNAYTIGIQDKNRYPVTVVENEKGYQITIKPMGAVATPSVVVYLVLAENILYITISYNTLATVSLEVNNDNLETTKERILKAIESYNRNHDITKFVKQFSTTDKIL